MAKGVLGPGVDLEWERDGADGEPSWGGTDCEFEGLLSNPPASFGSGWKRGETCTLILELERDAIDMCPWELVLDPDSEERKGGGEYCRTEDEDRDE